MNGVNFLKAVNARSAHAAVVRDDKLKVPNEKVRQIITKLLDDIDHYVNVNLPSDFNTHEIELATFRGAFIALRWSDDTITQVFAEKALLAFSEGGLAAVRASLT